MTNELVELENNYFVLSHIILQKIAKQHPLNLAETKNFLERLEKFSVYEKTFFLIELLQSLDCKKQEEEWQDLEKILKAENISESTTSLLKQYFQYF